MTREWSDNKISKFDMRFAGCGEGKSQEDAISGEVRGVAVKE